MVDVVSVVSVVDVVNRGKAAGRQAERVREIMFESISLVQSPVSVAYSVTSLSVAGGPGAASVAVSSPFLRPRSHHETFLYLLRSFHRTPCMRRTSRDVDGLCRSKKDFQHHQWVL